MVTTKGVLVAGWPLVAVLVAMHSNVWPFTAFTSAGQATLAVIWRFARRVPSMDAATLAVSTVVVAALSLELLEEPQALTSAAEASAAIARIAPRRNETAWVTLEVGRSICMRTY